MMRRSMAIRAFGIAHLIAPLGEVVASVGVEVVPYLLHV
jgi:hypothetical protein